LNFSDHVPTRQSVTVEDFFNTARSSLSMELVAGGAGLSRVIHEAAINRSGLALTGFYKHFAHKRIQLMGLAELAYLSSLDSGERSKKLGEFFTKKIPCLVVARSKRIFPEVIDLANDRRVPVIKTKMITKNFINAATIVMENLVAPRMQVQGTMVEIMGIGVLILGESGVGKSDTALSLLKKGHALVADDITALRLDSAGAVIASPVAVTRYHMEIKGVGIIHVPSLFGVASVRGEKRLDIVARLCPTKEGGREYVCSQPRGETEIFGVSVPELVITVYPGRDLANVIETAALNHKLRMLGHDAEKELDQKLMEAMTGGKVGSD
jgi:HPr kinase/phosphorylase